MNINYFMPTRIIMDDDCVRKNAAEIRAFGKKALIVTGAHSAKHNGSLDDIVSALKNNQQQYAIFDKIQSNPSVESVYEGAAFAKKESADFVIGIGGGSPMDAAKGIALLARQDIPQEKLFVNAFGTDVLPMIHVPTTAGTGSEVTQYAVLTNHTKQTKMSISAPELFPKIAILDAKYMEALPHTVMINTVVDSLSHSMEGSLCVGANPMTDLLAQEAIRLIAGCLPSLQQNTLTHEDRQKLLYASTLSGIVISVTGTSIVHAMGYALTYHRNIDHGRANGLLLPSFVQFTQTKRPDRVKMLLQALSLPDVNAFASVLDELLGQRETFTDEELTMYTQATDNPQRAQKCIVPPSKQDISEMYFDSLSVK